MLRGIEAQVMFTGNAREGRVTGGGVTKLLWSCYLRDCLKHWVDIACLKFVYFGSLYLWRVQMSMLRGVKLRFVLVHMFMLEVHGWLYILRSSGVAFWTLHDMFFFITIFVLIFFNNSTNLYLNKIWIAIFFKKNSFFDFFKFFSNEQEQQLSNYIFLQ